MLNKKLTFFTGELLSSFPLDDHGQHSCKQTSQSSSAPPHKKAFVNCGWPNCAAAVPLMLSRGDLWCGTVCNLEQDVGKWQCRALRDTLQFHLGVRCPMERLQYDLETTGQVLYPFQYRTPLEASEQGHMLLKKRSWHCYIFGNTKSLLRYISVSVIYYLWQLLFVCPILAERSIITSVCLHEVLKIRAHIEIL